MFLMSDPFRVDDFSVTTNLQNWSLTAVFSTSKVFSALGSYFVDIKEYTLGVCSSLQSSAYFAYLHFCSVYLSLCLSVLLWFNDYLMTTIFSSTVHTTVVVCIIPLTFKIILGKHNLFSKRYYVSGILH